jgi:hypothetical protein
MSISMWKRKLAVLNGAKELTQKELGRMLRSKRLAGDPLKGDAK